MGDTRIGMEYTYPVAFSCWGPEEFTAIARVLASDRYTMGAEVEAFEEEFARYHGMKHAIMVNSGSSANLIAVASLFHKRENPLRRGDKAIVPALAWATTYAPLVQYGLDLVLADCNETWGCNPFSYPREGSGARLIVGCSVLGNPTTPTWALFGIARDDVYHLEDNCESIGARTEGGELCGTFGLLNTFSFYHSHQLSAIEGGMVLTDDDELNGLCRMLRDHGMTRYAKPKSFEEEYDFRLMGYNVRPVELHAAIAREQLKKLDTFRKERMANWLWFANQARHLPVTLPKANGLMNPFGLNFTVESYAIRSRLADALRSNGVDCRLPTGGSFRRHRYAVNWANQPSPVADHIHECGLFLGNAPYGIDDKIERAVRIMKETL